MQSKQRPFRAMVLRASPSAASPPRKADRSSRRPPDSAASAWWRVSLSPDTSDTEPNDSSHDDSDHGCGAENKGSGGPSLSAALLSRDAAATDFASRNEGNDDSAHAQRIRAAKAGSTEQQAKTAKTATSFGPLHSSGVPLLAPAPAEATASDLQVAPRGDAARHGKVRKQKQKRSPGDAALNGFRRTPRATAKATTVPCKKGRRATLTAVTAHISTGTASPGRSVPPDEDAP